MGFNLVFKGLKARNVECIDHGLNVLFTSKPIRGSDKFPPIPTDCSTLADDVYLHLGSKRYVL